MLPPSSLSAASSIATSSTTATPSATANIAILGLGAIGSLMAWHWRTLKPQAIPRPIDSSSDVKASAHQPVQRRIILSALKPSADSAAEESLLSLELWQADTKLDWLVVTTKASHTLEAIQHLPLTKIKRILLLQNGMGQQQQVQDYLHKQQASCELWVGSSTEGAYRLNEDNDNHSVVYAGCGQTLIGLWSTSVSSPSSASLPPSAPTDQARLNSPLPQTQLNSDMLQLLRDKLAINAVINPLTAKWRCLNGELISQHAEQLMALTAEVAACYRHLGWQLSFDLSERVVEVAKATGQNRSSSLQDVLAGRETELAYINGYLLAQAEQAGFAMPLSQALMSELN